MRDYKTHWPFLPLPLKITLPFHNNTLTCNLKSLTKLAFFNWSTPHNNKERKNLIKFFIVLIKY